MKVTTHGAHLLKLTRIGAVNCYLVREEDGLTLVDTGIGGSAEQILAAAADAGAPIVRIALTHAHGDHVGSVDALHAELPDAEVSISARDARFLRGDKSSTPASRRARPAAATRSSDAAHAHARSRATASARWRSCRRPVTRRATLPSSTRATAR